jgi:hypothetical protein
MARRCCLLRRYSNQTRYDAVRNECLLRHFDRRKPPFRCRPVPVIWAALRKDHPALVCAVAIGSRLFSAEFGRAPAYLGLYQTLFHRSEISPWIALQVRQSSTDVAEPKVIRPDRWRQFMPSQWR